MRTALLALLVALPGQESRPVWQDEFDADGAPDAAKWGYEVGRIRNNELQYYTKDRRENARVEGGRLILEARKEPFEKAAYTAASLITKGKASWTTGRIEVRAKLPRGRGVWPAIWMLGDRIDEQGWPSCGEIDILEYVGYDPETVYANIHSKAFNHLKNNGRGSKRALAEPWKDFHVYAVDWTARRMDFSVDGQVYFTARNDGTGRDSWPFDQPHYLILNFAVGGTWGGLKGVDESVFPQRFEIDYVRVYAPKG